MTSFDLAKGVGDACRSVCVLLLQDEFRCEAVLYLWETVADFAGGREAVNAVDFCVHQTSRMVATLKSRTDEDVIRLFQTLMRVFFALSHLITEYDRVSSLFL